MKTRKHIPHSGSFRAAFTLIELLTVIAIIGILASILIPVVGRVRESARVSQCVVHLRDLGTGAHVYAGDNYDFLPPHLWGPDEDGPSSNWGSRIGPNVQGVIGLLLSPRKGGPDLGSWSGDYLDTPGPLYCPATRDELFSDPIYIRPEDVSETNRIQRAGYMWITRVPGDIGGRQENHKTTVDNPNAPYVFDFPEAGISSLTSPIFTTNPHESRVNVLHVGGHVTSFSMAELHEHASSGAAGTELFNYLTFRRPDKRF